jgi:hypothetical protein
MNIHSKTYTIVDRSVAFILAVVAILIYNTTLTPSLSYMSPDGNELATVPYVLGLAHSPGYPLYTWIGKIFTWLPIGDIAHRMNLMSAILGGVGVGCLYLILVAMLHPRTASPLLRRLAAGSTSILFAFSSTFWSQTGIAEVYAPNIAMIALTLLALLHWERTKSDWMFFLFALVFGLSLGTHLSNLGFAPAFALFILLTDIKGLKRPTWWLAGILGFGIGAAQFLWLPLRASTLMDRAMLARSPITIRGFYNYTLGAFSQLKFAFPLRELPDRLVIYIDLVRQEFGILGLFVGTIGLAALLLRRSRHYFLLVGMYLVNVLFFIQYQAFDLEVFFLPAHFLWAIFIAFGLIEILAGLAALIRHFPGRFAQRSITATLMVAVLFASFIPLLRNWKVNDRSKDVAINDFYANVWQILPENSTLLTHGGVFGYDAFYWQLVYDTRSDIELPSLPEKSLTKPDHRSRDIYTTTSIKVMGKLQGPQVLPPNLASQDLWQTPILIGNQSLDGFSGRERLTLYQLSIEPPLLVTNTVSPEIELQADLGGIILQGADLSNQIVESGSLIHIVFYWNPSEQYHVQVMTRLGEELLETHTLGFGNLDRYQEEIGPLFGNTIVEDYSIVIPSTISAGMYPLTIGIQGSEEKVVIGVVKVINEEETMKRWLRIVGKSP